MAKLWGNGTNGNEDKPNWLKPAELDRCYATPSGWVLKHNNGIEETLVAIRGLSLTGKLGAATIDKVTFSSGTFGRSQVKQVTVRFNEPVNVTGNPTLLVTSSAGGTVTATFASINANKNILTFNFTTPGVATTLSIAAQSVVLAGGTINEPTNPQQAGTVNAGLAISSTVATAAGTKVIA